MNEWVSECGKAEMTKQPMNHSKHSNKIHKMQENPSSSLLPFECCGGSEVDTVISIELLVVAFSCSNTSRIYRNVGRSPGRDFQQRSINLYLLRKQKRVNSSAFVLPLSLLIPLTIHLDTLLDVLGVLLSSRNSARPNWSSLDTVAVPGS